MKQRPTRTAPSAPATADPPLSAPPRLDAALSRAITAAAAGAESYVVGGTVRDLLRGRPSLDLDIAVDGAPAAISRRLAATMRGAFVPLDHEHGIYRVALREPVAGFHHVDVARLRAPTIEKDLAGRDFTVNAIALR